MTSVDHQWLQRIRYAAAEPTSWLMHARTLRQAAEDLWIAGNAHDRAPGSELGATVVAESARLDFAPPVMGGSTRDVCFMLFGFALENLTKGIIVCRDPRLVSKSRLRKWHGNGDDVLALFLRAKIQVSQEEKQLLDRTTRIAQWKGRYPVAMDFDKVGTHDRIVGHTAVSNVWPAEDYVRLCSLYDRAQAALVQTMKEVPPLPVEHNSESKQINRLIWFPKPFSSKGRGALLSKPEDSSPLQSACMIAVTPEQPSPWHCSAVRRLGALASSAIWQRRSLVERPPTRPKWPNDVVTTVRSRKREPVE